MLERNNTFAQNELLASFEKVHHEVAAYFLSVPLESFFKSPSGKWSPAENLLHLIKSVKPVAMAMTKPRLLLRILFGKPRAASRRYEQVVEAYQRKLAEGGKAPGRFVPVLQEPQSNLAQVRDDLVQKWKATGEHLIAVLSEWQDEKLDQYFLPHPLLGKLTLREMLLFTLYHDLHHVNNVRKLLEHKDFFV